MESSRKGLSDMDVARALPGHGWPVSAGPWSDDGTREPDGSRAGCRGEPFWFLFWRLKKETRQARRNRRHQQGSVISLTPQDSAGTWSIG